MKIRYLVDENLSARVVATIQRHYPQLDVLRVGDPGAPGFGTLDPDLLGWLEINQRVLVTDNRKSMPGHVADHLGLAGAIGASLWCARMRRCGHLPIRCMSTGMSPMPSSGWTRRSGCPSDAPS